AGGALFRQRPGRRARARFARDLGIRGHARRRAAAGEIHPVGGERGDVRALPRLQGRPGPHPFHHEAAEDLKIPDSVYNAWRITSLSTLPSWVLALAVTALAAAVWLSFRGFRTEPAGRRRAALLAFRLMAALLVLVLLLEPGIELRAESRVRARVALLFDTSRSMAGLFVASDGADNAELSQGVSPAAAAELRRLNAPVFVLPVGAQALKDLAVEKIAVDDFAFVRNQVTVDVIVTARGFGSTEVPVVLRREGQVVAQKTIHIDGSRSRY